MNSERRCVKAPSVQGSAWPLSLLLLAMVCWAATTPAEGQTRVYELEVYRISDTTGTAHTSAPGSARTSFARGETVRVTMRARNTGSATENVAWVVNLAVPSGHSTPVYDSHLAGDPVTSLPNNGSWYLQSFDWPSPTTASTGAYDLLGALRLGSNWTTVLDDTQPGTNTVTVGSSAWRTSVLTLTTGSVSGTVKSRYYPYMGIPGATVTANGSAPAPTATTGDDGSYTLSGVAGGQRTITASHSDYWATGSATSASQAVNVVGAVTGVNFADFGGRGTPQVTITPSKTQVEPGETFSVTVTLTNTNYALGNVRSFLDLSFSDSKVTVGTPTGSGWSSLTPVAVGQPVMHADGQWRPSTEYLVSGERAGSFGFNASYSFTVPLTVKTTATGGPITLKYRGTLGDRRDPTSGTQDQQNFYVYTRDVTVSVRTYELEVYRISDTTGTAHTSAPGSARTELCAGGNGPGDDAGAEHRVGDGKRGMGGEPGGAKRP